LPRTLAIIPARLDSTRLARKVLREVAGQPLLAWVVQAAQRVSQLDDVIVAVDSDEVAALCRQRGWKYQMTSRDLPSGTDRMHAVSLLHPADLYVNIQGDEPTLTHHHIEALLRPFDRGEHIQATTIRVRCTPENISNPNAVKVVTSTDHRALYFSRATIPYDRDAASASHRDTCAAEYWKHIGLYAFRAETLARFPSLPSSMLEKTERLEQLRLLENNIALYVETVEHDTIGVDTEEDLQRVAKLLSV